MDITKYLYDRFQKLGIPVKVTRLTDETITPTDRVQRVLDAYGNSKDVIVISSHINAGGGDGAEIIYPLRANSVLPNLILSEISKEGQNIRDAYQRRLPSDTSKDYYFMQRNTGDTDSLTVEYGFLDSTADDVTQLKNDYKNYAEAVVRAVTNYIGATYVAPVGSNTYIVKSGDSLWSIAKKYNTTATELKTLNNLTSNLLSIGQILKLPTTEIATGNTYIVKSGDTLYGIASKYSTTVDAIKTLNNLTSNILSVGQSLILPGTTESVPTTNYQQYTVKSGDTLYGIAIKYGTTVDKLKSYNNLVTNSLSIGQIIKIPTETTNTYKVVSGDTLYSIASKNNTTVDSIKNKNNLTSNVLSVGQILII